MAKQTELKNLLQELEVVTRHHELVRTTPFQANQQARAFQKVDVAEKRVFSFFDALNTELADSARAYKNLQDQRNYLAQERDEARKAAEQWQNAAQKAKADLQELAQQVLAMTPTEAPTVPPGNDLDQYEFTDHPKAAGFNGALADALENGWTVVMLKQQGYIKVRDSFALKQVMAMKPADEVAPVENEPFNSTRAAAGDPIEVLMAPGVWVEKKFIGTFIDSRDVPMVSYVYEGEPDWVGMSQVRMKPKAPQQLQMFADVYRNSYGGAYGYLHSEPKSKRPPNAPTMPGIEQLVSDMPVTITVAK